LAQPPGTVAGQIQLTEQGEVIQGKYNNAEVGRWHLELLVAATLESSLAPKADAASAEDAYIAQYGAAMSFMSDHAQRTYRGLVYETPGFAEYFFASTPISEIAGLNIGSRPACRAICIFAVILSTTLLINSICAHLFLYRTKNFLG
jgi:phosphoenolpyruvate carboxylase